jgi:DNA-directed RNA polymerase specialized sigma24 family protein
VLKADTRFTSTRPHPDKLVVPQDLKPSVLSLAHRKLDRRLDQAKQRFERASRGLLPANGWLFWGFPGLHVDFASGCIDRGMDTTFAGYLGRRNDLTNSAEKYSAFSEVSEFFPRQGINTLFHQEVGKLLERPALSPESRQELTALLEFDWVGYMDRSLRRAGFRDPDLDQLVQDLAVKLLLTKFFTGWSGGSSLKARFLVAVRNAIATLVVRRNRQRTRSHELVPDIESRPVQASEDIIDEFRDYLRSHFGMVAVSVFDQRVSGEDTKELLGQQGLETSYRLKKVVADIKAAARRFAARDPDFRNMVRKAFDAEATTITRRFKKDRV